MPLRIEQRAKAFAAEFLLPSAEAGPAWQRAGSPMEPSAVYQFVKGLSTKYKVTEAVASWQLEHGVSPFYQEPLSQVLDVVVPASELEDGIEIAGPVFEAAGDTGLEVDGADSTRAD